MSHQIIRVLDDTTINQIAAGEVIENPASVVKELVENAIDSGASEIAIETKAGGRNLIRVADNGCGMDPDNLVLCIERHATSKLRAVEGLQTLHTLGFRGEALPSIASVSKMTLHSAACTGSGSILRIEGGKLGALSPLPRNRGTTVEVHSLFYNVPVRKEFQKSVAADTAEIHKILSKYSLCYPSLSCSWTNDEKLIWSFNPLDDEQKRIKVILGEEFANHLLRVEQKEGNLKLRGYISNPAYHRPNKSGQHLFINQRSVYSPFVALQITEGYGMRLPSNRFPLFVLHLEMPPSWIDVNVHPQKKEVRIAEEKRVVDFIQKAISRALDASLQKPAPAVFSSTQDTLCMNLCEPIAGYRTQVEMRDSETCALITQGINILGRVKNYFFVEDAEGCLVVDIYRVLERVVFEELSNKQQKKEVQSLLLPLHLSMSGKEKILLEMHLEKFQEIGINIRPFGKDAFIVDAIPAILEPSEIEDFVHAFLEKGAIPDRMNKCLKRKAISLETAKFLIEKLMRYSNPEHTQCGEKIFYLLNETNLIKLLK